MLYVPPTISPIEKKLRERLKAARERMAGAAYHPTPVEKIAPKPEPELLTQSEPTAEKKPYRPWFRIMNTAEPMIRDIQDAVCDYFDISREHLLSTRRNPSLVIPRHIAMYLARELTAKTYPEIGRAFKRDHTVPIYAAAKIEKLIRADAWRAHDVAHIERILRGWANDSITPCEDSGNENVASGREASKPSPDRNGIDAARSDDTPAQG